MTIRSNSDESAAGHAAGGWPSREGRATAEPLCDVPHSIAAAWHRATFPLQIACVGYLHDDQRLFETGVKNFVSRDHSGTLHWPAQ